MFYKCPKRGDRLSWLSQAANPVIRFTETGLVLLFRSPSGSGADEYEQWVNWLSGPVQLGLYGLHENPLTPAPDAGPLTPPVLVVGLAGFTLAAPICLPELSDEAQQVQWLNTRGPLELRLVLLTDDEQKAEHVASVVDSRRYWHAGWIGAQVRLRRQLEALLLDIAPGQEGQVQANGRELVARMGAAELLARATLKLSDDCPQLQRAAISCP